MRSIVVGTAGHIDHGKSALVRALTGTDPDRLKEEKARGITIDLGFAHLADGDTTFAFVDVPGHERFVRNMLAGAGGIDLVLLVVAADESVMPQTREHFAICRLLEVPAGAIVLTKTDLADREMREFAALESRELVAGSFLEDAPLVAVSAKSGDGLDDLRGVLRDLAKRVTPRNARGSTRLPVDRVFTLKGFGTVATGTLVSGTMREGQPLAVLPRGLAASARGIQVHGRQHASAEAGHRVAVNLGGVEVADLARGDTLCEPGSLEPTARFDVLLHLLADARPLRHGARVRFHQGTMEVMGRVALAVRRGPTNPERLRPAEGDGVKLADQPSPRPRRSAGASAEAESRPLSERESRWDPTSSENTPATELRPGNSAYARLRVEHPAVVTRGDRFIIRAYSPTITIGGGVVLDPHPPRTAVRTAAGIARLRQLDPSVLLDHVLVTFIEERGSQGLSRAAVLSRAGASPEAADASIRRLTDAGQITVVGDLLISRHLLEEAADRLLEALKAHHAAHPMSEGMHREEARARLMPHAVPAVFDAVVVPLVATGRIASRDRLSLAGHAVALSADETRVRDALVRVYYDAGLTPPDAAGACAAAGGNKVTADRITSLLIRQRTLVKLDTLLFHADRLEALKTDIRALKGSAAAAHLDVATFKERYGITRKFAIPLLEYLDRERVTKREGESRVLV